MKYGNIHYIFSHKQKIYFIVNCFRRNNSNVLKSGYNIDEINRTFYHLEKFFIDFKYTSDFEVVDSTNVQRKSIILKFTHKSKATNIVTPVVYISECD